MIQKIDIKKVKPNKDNPRKLEQGAFQKLKKSIQDFPEMLELRPLILDENNIVLGWNMRLKALKELWYKEVPYIKAEDLTEEQKKEFIIKDNVSFGDWDIWLLEELYDEEIINDWWLDISFDMDEDIDFDNIKDNSNRETKDNTKLVECPHCWKSFNL